MPIFTGSRYVELPFTALIGSDGITKKFLHLRVPPSYRSEVQHELIPTEELDFLSFRYGGQARLWWRIAEANGLFWPFELANGTKLDMPF